MGSEVAQTPHLDELAARGMVLPQGFSTSSVCRAALRSLLTGLTSEGIRTRIAAYTAGGARVRSTIELFDTLLGRLAERGYASFQGGKHWEGHFRRVGFSEGTATERFEGDLKQRSGGEGRELGRDSMQPLFDFIDAHADEPFFAQFAPLLPHVPHDAGPEYLARYAGIELDEFQLPYFANVSRLDARVGELLAHLDRRGLRERTVVAFLADNGWEPVASADPGLGGARAKSSPYELGFRTPMLVSWPGTLPQGRRSDDLVSSVDLVRTLLDLAGAEPPPGDGRSLVPVLRGRSGFERKQVLGGQRRIRSDALLAPGGAVFFARTSRWRCVWAPGEDRKELYRIELDPFETRNVLASHAEEARRLRADIERWREEVEEAARPWALERLRRAEERGERRMQRRREKEMAR